MKPDALISFIDGKPYKTLRRHLTAHGLSMEEYRARYGLPNDYPSVSANYSAARSALAKGIGLGQQRRKVEVASEPVPEPAAKPKRAGRPVRSPNRPDAHRINASLTVSREIARPR